MENLHMRTREHKSNDRDRVFGRVSKDYLRGFFDAARSGAVPVPISCSRRRAHLLYSTTRVCFSHTNDEISTFSLFEEYRVSLAIFRI